MTALSIVDDLLYMTLGVVVVLTIGVAVALSRNKYRTTLRTHAARANFSEAAMSRDDRIFLRSMQAEEAIETILREEGWRNVYLRRRVAVARVGHNREIDAIAVGPVVLVVEVKNWQGYVWSNGPRWFQRANIHGNSTLEFEDVLEDNVVKAAALRRYIENARRIQLPDFASIQEDAKGGNNDSVSGGSGGAGTWYSDSTIHKQCGHCILPVVVFTNKKVILDPATVKAKKYVFTLQTFREFAREAIRGNISLDAPNSVPNISLPMRMLRSLLPISDLSGLSSKVALDLRKQEEVSHAIDVMRTWDMIYLHDGRLLTGDVQKVDCPSAFCMYERKHLLDIHVWWNTGVVGTALSFMVNKAGIVELVLSTAKRLAVKKKERKPRNHKGNVVFTILPKHTNRNLDDRLVIKLAGTTDLKIVSFTDIREVRLSHHLHEEEKNL